MIAVTVRRVEALYIESMRNANPFQNLQANTLVANTMVAQTLQSGLDPKGNGRHQLAPTGGPFFRRAL